MEGDEVHFNKEFIGQEVIVSEGTFSRNSWWDGAPPPKIGDKVVGPDGEMSETTAIYSSMNCRNGRSRNEI